MRHGPCLKFAVVPMVVVRLAWNPLADSDLAEVVLVADLPGRTGEGQRMTGAGKGRPAGMAILDTETGRTDPVIGRGAPGVLRAPGVIKRRVDEIVAADTEVDHAGAVARVRRHALRRLLIADVFGLALAAFVGPLLVRSSPTTRTARPATVGTSICSTWPSSRCSSASSPSTACTGE